jgi:hypothetical protein
VSDRETDLWQQYQQKRRAVASPGPLAFLSAERPFQITAAVRHAIDDDAFGSNVESNADPPLKAGDAQPRPEIVTPSSPFGKLCQASAMGLNPRDVAACPLRAGLLGNEL